MGDAEQTGATVPSRPSPRSGSSASETDPVRPSTMVPIELGGLARLAGLPVPDSGVRVAATGVTLRAQQARPGDLYAALPSLSREAGRAHGADFAAVAVGSGAVAVLTDADGAARPAAVRVAEAGVPVLIHPEPRAVLGRLAAALYGDPSHRLAVLGITGTAGKTTTTYLLESGLRAAGHSTGLLGTVESRIGARRLAAAHTTPEAPELQALLAVMVEHGVTHLPMEVSSHGLALGRITGTSFAVGGFTNLSQEHLDFHRGLEDYFAAKSLLFDGRAASEVVCVDDPWGRRLARPGRITVSLDGDADWRAGRRSVQPAGGQSFRALGPDGIDQPVSIRLPGAFNVANALLAMAMGHAAGADPARLACGIAEADVPGRLQRVERGQPFLALVDYAHKPAAVAELLDAVRTQVTGRVLAVLGCGGNRDPGKRPVMGAEAARRADLLVVTDDNPRDEDPAAIRAAMLDGARGSGGAVREVADRAEAIGTAVAEAGPQDAVVVAGKGHETGQEISGTKHPFDDAEVLAAALERWGAASRWQERT